MDNLAAIGLILLLLWAWLDSLRAREIATSICRAACRHRGLQFLDDTVALRALRITWRSQGVRLRRAYSFDFSEEGLGRRSGYIVLRGISMEELSFGVDTGAEEA